jgi:hypothetical protein
MDVRFRGHHGDMTSCRSAARRCDVRGFAAPIRHANVLQRGEVTRDAFQRGNVTHGCAAVLLGSRVFCGDRLPDLRSVAGLSHPSKVKNLAIRIRQRGWHVPSMDFTRRSA